jgi:alanine racemase
MPEPTTSGLRAWVEIDLAALERNLVKIKSALPAHVRYISVVKADAYGHGVKLTVPRLLHCGVDCFCVANVREGTEVREIGSGTEILVLGAVLPEEAARLLDYDLTATLSTEAEADALDALARARGRRLAVHVKIDTGMGRMGVWHERAPELLRHVLACGSLELRGVYTHFSSAENDPDFTALQRSRFVGTLPALPAELCASGRLLIHADNSAGLETFAADGPFNAVRVGLLQYGLPPGGGSLLASLHTEPVLSFHSRVGLVKTLPAGTPVSYNQTRVLHRESRVAVVTAGYGDGVPRTASDRAWVLIRGSRCPVLGRVTMDQLVVDVSDVPGAVLGDTVTFIGRQAGGAVSMGEFCAWADMIPWDVFCSITKRVQRVQRGRLGL